MATKMGIPVILTNLEYRVNVPLLLTKLSVAENHNDTLMGIHILSKILDMVAVRTMQLNDEILIGLLTDMKLLQPIVKKDSNDPFGDV